MKTFLYKIFVVFAALMSPIVVEAQDEEAFEQLIEWMTGEFDSAEQAAQDTNYFNVSLKMTRIWPDKEPGAWIYVEQALASTPDKPYRQRVYFVAQLSDEDFSSDVYMLKDEAQYVGAWKTPNIFNSKSTGDLIYKEGCAVFLFYDGFQYGGKTNTGTCESNLRGAAYATSEVSILSDQIQSWDRGYSQNGAQVWGAEKGGYIFKRKN